MFGRSLWIFLGVMGLSRMGLGSDVMLAETANIDLTETVNIDLNCKLQFGELVVLGVQASNGAPTQDNKIFEVNKDARTSASGKEGGETSIKKRKLSSLSNPSDVLTLETRYMFHNLNPLALGFQCLSNTNGKHCSIKGGKESSSGFGTKSSLEIAMPGEFFDKRYDSARGSLLIEVWNTKGTPTLVLYPIKLAKTSTGGLKKFMASIEPEWDFSERQISWDGSVYEYLGESTDIDFDAEAIEAKLECSPQNKEKPITAAR